MRLLLGCQPPLTAQPTASRDLPPNLAYTLTSPDTLARPTASPILSLPHADQSAKLYTDDLSYVDCVVSVKLGSMYDTGL